MRNDIVKNGDLSLRVITGIEGANEFEAVAGERFGELVGKRRKH